MSKNILAILLVFLSISSMAQQSPGWLTVEKIMRDPKWIGSSPSSPQWSADGHQLFFNWNPDKAPDDSLYYIIPPDRLPVKATVPQKQDLVTNNMLTYNVSRTAYVYGKDGDIFYHDIKTRLTRRLTQTTEIEGNPQFSFNGSRIVYTRAQNLYAWDIATGETLQLTNLRSGEAAAAGTAGRNDAANSQAKAATTEEDWLKNDQVKYFEVLRSRKEKRELSASYTRSAKQKELRTINIGDRILQGLTVSPDGRFISYRLTRPATNAKATLVPAFVTETGYTTDIPGRSKVGAPQGVSEFYLYDRDRDSVFTVKTDSIPGIRDIPAYVKDYPKQLEEWTKKNANRSTTIFNPDWSPRGGYALLDIRAEDNKDRWLMTWDTATHRLQLLDRQHDDAWIGGTGIFGNTGWVDETTCWFQSEETGYSHLYLFHLNTKEKKALTAGNYEVQQAKLSNDRKYFFISTNEVHPGEQQFYRLAIATGVKTRLTTFTGSNQVTLSPDEKHLAILYSYSTKPWELYVRDIGSKPSMALQVTNKAQSDEFKSYAWKDPGIIQFTAADGAKVFARLYVPPVPDPHKPAVLFVHGAGYLQNAHKWWSSYFREYMFNNLLADKGYYVMDIDYRGSAGYGRDWRTGIYRYMGGKDLSDHVDAVHYLVKNFGVDPERVGLYGGSYGGFITLMALFTDPGVFAAGAALRPVTDWANYNHSYTDNILNAPFNDSIAYRRSSPFYFANGLKGHLLICHGMVDGNVHFQDAVKLSQRLIELGKDDWELAPYPMEDHGFIEPSSWTDEYKRILKLFETVLKKDSIGR